MAFTFVIIRGISLSFTLHTLPQHLNRGASPEELRHFEVTLLMAGFFDKIKGAFGTGAREEGMETRDDGYVELGAEDLGEHGKKVTVRPYVIEDFEHVKPVLDALRQGSTIALINIKPLKEKGLVELKRAVNKLKKTCDAIDGDIAGFGDDWIAATPSFAQIHRKSAATSEQQPKEPQMEPVTEYSDDSEQ